MKNHRKPWTDEEDAQLSKLLKIGHTYEEIAKIMGRERNAIAGRNHRKRIKVSKHKRTIPPSVAWSAIKVKRPDEVYIIYGEGKSLLDLQANECKFKVEGTELFCAKKCNGNYCKDHKRICHL